LSLPIVAAERHAVQRDADRIFAEHNRNRGCLPEVKQQIIDMSLNASGVRDTARVLRISTDTVLSELIEIQQS
jgi:transposase-like protein